MSAADATGRELRAWMELREAQLRLRVDGAGATYPLVIDPFIQQAKPTAANGAPGDLFGYSVAVSGDTVVVGAPSTDIGANFQQGAAYVFVTPANGWAGALAQSAKLTASDGAVADSFGLAVAVSGDTVVVGAHYAAIGANIYQGAAYVFVTPANGWAGTLTESAKLTTSDGAAGDLFGYSVAVSGDTVVVGAAWASVGGKSKQGVAYVFVTPANGWAGALTESAKLTASDGAAGDLFGLAVVMSGDTVVVGAHYAAIGANFQQGAAYVFVTPANSWAGARTESAKVTASDSAAGDLFGYPWQ